MPVLPIELAEVMDRIERTEQLDDHDIADAVLAEEILDYIPSWRTEDVVYFNPADRDYPVGFNLLKSAPPDAKHLVASSIVSALKSIWRDSWGPRLEYLLYASAAALLDVENASLLGIQRLLIDPLYRGWVIRQVKDPVVRAFWVNEFEGYDARFRSEIIAPIQNKVGQLLMSPPIRNILGQVKSRIDPAYIMDHRRIFIANLSKGQMGEDKSNLLGAVLLSQFQLAAMARSSQPEAQRQDFFLFVDEFQNFTTSSLASILSECRKHKLGIALFHQYMEQLTEPVRDAVFGNCGTLISFRVGEKNAAILAREFGGLYDPSTFSALSNFEVCVKLLQRGSRQDAFLGTTLAPIGRHYGRRDTIVRRSRQRYATPRGVVEQRIERWMRNRT